MRPGLRAPQEPQEGAWLPHSLPASPGREGELQEGAGLGRREQPPRPQLTLSAPMLGALG